MPDGTAGQTAFDGGTLRSYSGAAMAQMEVNPYLLPDDQHGWRGLGLAGHRRRKWYTILHNEQILVTALLLIPGERSVRHSHETGELSIHYDGEMKPVVLWNPPGVLHGGPGVQMSAEPAAPDWARRAQAQLESLGGPGNSELAALVGTLLEGQLQLREQVERLARPQPAPRIIVDVLFPPFRTTIDDPAYPEKKVITGQWFD